jgi:hypothetical protein
MTRALLSSQSETENHQALFKIPCAIRSHRLISDESKAVIGLRRVQHQTLLYF